MSLLAQPETAPVGLIAGAGRFPIHFAEKARSLGIPVVCIGIAGMADPVLAEICPRFFWLNRMSLGFVFRKFRNNHVERWTMAGKFHKVSMFGPFRWLRMIPDWRAIRFWYYRVKSDRRDDPILLALIDEFHQQGMHCVSALDICPELLVRAGLLTRRCPTPSEERDIQFGWRIAKEMGRLDIGQSVMVREGVILAVEAIEGTDQAILRAGDLAKKTPFVVVKVAKPQQDSRFDVPTVGEQTIRSMMAAGARVLAIEAGQTIIIDEEKTIALADEHGMTIQSLPSDRSAI
jgi:UDP-2,3-diacylglucosamine hydrolase